jgi:hypothetical protein
LQADTCATDELVEPSTQRPALVHAPDETLSHAPEEPLVQTPAELHGLHEPPSEVTAPPLE